MKRMSDRSLPALAGLLACMIGLTACGNTTLSTAASMRVEVEVYKGPLSRDPESQIGEYMAALDEASEAMDVLYRALIAQRKGTDGPTLPKD
jgi:hypothetical protein